MLYRLQDVALLRASQFSEDAGPMAHPIRPDSYIKMDNFYTVTVYEKVRPAAARVMACTVQLLGGVGCALREGMLQLAGRQHVPVHI
jgi:aminopeptidase N